MDRRTVIASLAALALAACKKKPEGPGAAEGAAFLVENGKKADVVTTASGLQYRIVKSGPADGVHPRPQDEVKVHYEGKLLNDEVFDSSYEGGQPAVFQLGGLIPAWIEALQLMKPGDQWELFVPAKLGYGAQGSGPIPPNSTLKFRIELLGVLPAAGGLPLS